MRIALAALVTLIAGSAFDAARADQYKWCAAYGGSKSGSYNCYFITLQQCQAAVSGVGGSCEPSPFANSPTTGPAPAQRRKKN